jgi:hypothetical protein
VVAGGRHGRRLGRMSDAEWGVTLEVLGRHGAWPRLWRLALEAPPRWAAPILQKLGAAGWAPGGAERTDYEELSRLAPGWDGSALGPAEFGRGTLTGHEGAIECLAVSPDGRVLASADAGGAVRLWTLPDGAPRQTLRGHAGAVNCLVFSPGGQLLFSGGDDGNVCEWKLPEGRRLRTLQGCTGRVTALALTPDGKTLVSQGHDSPEVWDLAEKEPEAKPLGGIARPTCLAVSPSGEVLATGCADHTVWLSWHLPHPELQDALAGHAGPVTGVAFSADGQTLASAARDGTVRLWDVGSGQMRRRLGGDRVPLAAPEFEPDPHALVGRRHTRLARLWPLPEGKVLAARARGRSIRLWTPADGRAFKTLRGHAGTVTCLAAGPAARLLASGGADRTVRLWGLPTRLARLGQTPVARMSLGDWEWVRARLGQAGLPASERQGLLFLDALLRRRWRAEVHVDEATSHRTGAHDIALEE